VVGEGTYPKPRAAEILKEMIVTGQPVAIVTGAGSGVGQATCVQLAALGWSVALVGRTESKLKETASMMGAEASLIRIVGDMAAPTSPKLIADRTLELLGRIDAVVNNAAMLITGPIETMGCDAMNQTFAANTIGPALLVNAAWPEFVNQKSGCIVNASSMSAHDPFPGLGMYGASKAASEGFVRAYAKEGKKHNIRAFAIAPGAIETAMLRSTFNEKMLPKSKTLSPEAVAKVIVACVTGERDAENGKTIMLPSP